MDLKITGWTSNGLRCPDADIDLMIGDKVARVSFIQMLNGTGKTTTLELLKICLSGKINAVDDPKGLLRQTSNLGSFILETLIDGVKYSFEVVIDRGGYGIDENGDSKEIKIFTTSPFIGGKEPGWRPPHNSRQYLSDAFIKLFVFNAEYAEELFKKDKTTAKRSVETLCQLDILVNAKNLVKKYLDENKGEIGTADQGALTRKNNENLRYELRLKTVIKELREKDTLFLKEQDELKTLESELKEKIKEDKETQNYKNKLDAEIKSNQDDIGQVYKLIYDILVNPIKINSLIKSDIVSFRENLAKLKLPGDAAKPFFSELVNAKNPICICGTPIGEKEKKNILINSERYLDDATVGVLNALKHDIDKFSNEQPIDLENLILKLSELDRKKGELSLALSQFETKIGSLDEMFKTKLERRAILEEKQKRDLDEISKYKAPSNNDDIGKDPEVIINIANLETIIKSNIDEIDKIKNTVQLRQASRIFTEIMEESRTRASKILFKKLTITVQKRIDIVLSESPLKIKEIGDYIQLESNQPVGSVGQSLATAYTFLGAALASSNNQLPFIVDSPCGSMDPQVSTEVAKSIPEATKQFITFIQPRERPYFAKAVALAAEKKVTYHTIFNNSELSKNLLNRVRVDENKKISSRDWTMVIGEDFFYKFDLVEEAY
jgi:DNA sulfur modification protein DndD